MKPKLLIFSLGRRGAAPNQTLELARAMMARDEVALSLCISDQSDRHSELIALGLPTLSISTFVRTGWFDILATLWRLPLGCVRFLFFMIAQRPDMVLCPMGHLWNPFFVLIMRVLGARYALMVHDGQVKIGDHMSAPQRLNELDMRLAEKLIVMTEHVRMQLVDGLGRTAKDILIVPLGPFETAAGTVKRTADKATPTKLLFFGRILEYKGVDILLEAFAQLLPSYPSLELLIAGEGDVTPYKSALAGLPEVRVDSRYLAEDEIPALFAASDIVVLPYREATQSGIIAIAQVAGVPIVSTPVGGLKEQIEDGVTGVLSTDIRPESFSAAIRRLLDDPGLYRKIAMMGQEHSRKLWDIAARDIAGLVKKVRAEKHGLS